MLEKEYKKVLENLRNNVGVIDLILTGDFYNESSWSYVAEIKYKDSVFDVRKIRYRSINDPVFHAIRVPARKNKFNVSLILIDHIPSLKEFIYIEEQLKGEFRKDDI